MAASAESSLPDGTKSSLPAAVALAARKTRRRLGRICAATSDHSHTWYSKIIVQGLLRQKPLKPSQDGRHIPLRIEHASPLLDERRGRDFISNTIRTSRYTPWDFIPKQLYFQFTRLANFYFLCVGIPQTLPGLSTTGSFTTILPLLFFVLLTILKEGYDDFKRSRLDALENANIATVLGKPKPPEYPRSKSSRPLWQIWAKKNEPGVSVVEEEVEEDLDDTYQWNKVQWRNIKVGDMIRLSRDEDVPADIVLLYATGEDGVAYIDTMALDGETNLKSKTPLPAFKECSSIAAIRSLDAEFIVEDPNPDLYSFDGKVVTDGKTMPLTSNEVVYRGCTLRNTKYAVGIVINTGEECKIRLNANQHPEAKKPALEKISNRIVVFLALYVIALTVGLSMAYFQWQREVENSLGYLAGETVLTKEVVIGYAIQFNNVIPLALYISLEIVKLGQMFMLDSDTEMYHAPTDTPAKCNTNTILENLGQVTHIFSDKTGTLTENEMKFRKMSIAGTAWLHDKDLEGATTPSQGEPTPPQGETTTLRREPTRQSAKTAPRKSREVTRVVEELDADEDSVASPVAITVTSPALPRMSSQLHPRPSSQLNRRSSSQWRSTGRPDHVQPDVTTTDLLEYIRMRPASPFARKARDYILCMAICHTCLPEVRDGKVDFQAASPDELALVRAAMELGYLVANRSSREITLKIDIGDGDARTERYEVLDVIEFSSARKRMSVVVRYPDGRIYAICKGADSTILPRLKLANLAHQKAEEVRKSADLEHEMIRRSEQLEPRNSFGGRPSLSISRKSMALQGQPGPSRLRPAIERSKSVEARHMRNSEDRSRPSLGVRTVSLDISKALSPYSPMAAPVEDERFGFLSDPLINDEAEVFTRCFKHLDEFASEGLRTLLYARKFIPEQEYKAWKKIYDDATTSLTNRQDKIEAAGELIEQSLDLVGATAIEDKLQDGVPETIEKLGRANIKIWMLTGDKRETAINIAHSARLCRPASDIFILDSTKDDLEGQMMNIVEELQTGCVHSVVVVDGHTLGVIEQKAALKELFFALVPTIDSVICCRASPAQKATIVQALRSLVRGALTLAIGDGANDLAMISAAHVGVGISGKEGLQAARVADYAIAQFRFLQRLLLVHGRWNYVRTAKFILATFWKEMFFYVPTAVYQRYNGYTGTSLYESTSLTVFNTLFTSLAVILPGIFEKDLEATTLLAVPELYVYGQRNSGLNAPKFVAWMMAGAAQGVCVWFAVWAGYGGKLSVVADDNLYALGSLAFTIGVVWINIKLLILETHDITNIILGGFGITFIGWWVWLIFLSVTELNPDAKLLYAMKDTFLHTFGADPGWWATVVSVVVTLVVVDVAFRTFRHKMIVAGAWKWPPWAKTAAGNNAEEFHVEVWQNLEKDPVMQARMRRTLEAEKGLSDEERAKIVLEEEQANIILEQEGVAMERLR